MKEPKISIIVPIYKVEAYLDLCLQSILNQTLKDIEVILVDDESPDNCPRICDEYAKKDSRIKVIHKKNEGLGLARNSGIKEAHGKYISFIDSDDYIDECTYSELLEEADSKQLDAIYFAYERFFPNGNTSGHCNINNFEYFTDSLEIRRFLLDMIGTSPNEKKDRKIQVSSCCALYKKEIIDNYKILFHSERELISEDLIFNIDFLYHAKHIAITPKTFYHYRINQQSLTRIVRFDRIEKNKILYLYLKNKLKEINLGEEANLRNIRLFIGYSRFAIRQVCKSNISLIQKKRWLSKICQDYIWKEIAQQYPYKKLPLKYKLFFYLTFKQHINLLFLLARL
ncbi:glycosyltransferase family 2 protein [Phocaeicola coprophilus]|uniref:glycosyltransferase family 2 protein n=1 Tax=Phocaeicola coprophilus TaxID=387090 RepID=UPI0022E0957A|nr:glycosyltransferase [Phocaeicola coprophilus]